MTHCSMCRLPKGQAHQDHGMDCACAQCLTHCRDDLAICSQRAQVFFRQMEEVILELHSLIPELYTSALKVAALATRIKGTRGD